MEGLPPEFFAFLGALELAILALVAGVILFRRGNRLSRKVLALQKQLENPAEAPAPIGFDQYLRDEVLRNEGLIDQAAASEDESEKKAAELLKFRKRFLEIELEAQALEGNPVAFQDKIAAGMCELVEIMRPDAETVEVEREAEPVAGIELEEAPDDDAEAEAVRKTIDTAEAEVSHLKDVINNQQDAMEALRAQLEASADEVEGMDAILKQLADFEKQSAELKKCLLTLESENERLKASQSDGGQAGSISETAPAQLTGLKNMVGSQQETIDGLRRLIGELMPEADKAAELEESLNRLQNNNKELSGCVSVLEDENAMLRSELEEIGRQLEEQDAQREAAEAAAAEAAAAEPDSASHSEQMQEMEIKVQELEALVEFKDATIEELEKQYNALEVKLREATGEQSD